MAAARAPLKGSDNVEVRADEAEDIFSAVTALPLGMLNRPTFGTDTISNGSTNKREGWIARR